jgi:hypothetical protein
VSFGVVGAHLWGGPSDVCQLLSAVFSEGVQCHRYRGPGQAAMVEIKGMPMNVNQDLLTTKMNALHCTHLD